MEVHQHAKKTEPTLTSSVQVGNQEFNITDIAAKAYKPCKSVHMHKVVTDFKVYDKPEESTAYDSVNDEGSEDFKIEL